ncbi:hypothetical protein Q1695_011740 [Nippostrongylus brasiliensis]|nr:hypothetical protein Q1695_011740 [Nippostrongylus brasiliensis]
MGANNGKPDEPVKASKSQTSVKAAPSARTAIPASVKKNSSIHASAQQPPGGSNRSIARSSTEKVNKSRTNVPCSSEKPAAAGSKSRSSMHGSSTQQSSGGEKSKSSDQGEVKRSSQQGDVHHTAEGTQLSEDAMNERMIKEAQKKIKHECDDSRESNRRGKKKAASSEHKGGMAASSKKGQKANKSQERIVKGSSNERRPASKKPKAVIKSDVPIPEVTNNSICIREEDF